jgi:hypothetical protein
MAVWLGGRFFVVLVGLVEQRYSIEVARAVASPTAWLAATKRVQADGVLFGFVGAVRLREWLGVREGGVV